MRFHWTVFVLFSLAGVLSCSDHGEPPASEEMQTIDNTLIESRPIEKDQTLDFDSAVLASTADQTTGDGALGGAPADLPFAPAISMDPVDGSKVSIRSDTPTAEYDDLIYYFSSEENRGTFLQNPEQYIR